MLTLGPADTLSGSAGAAAAVTCTIFGDDVLDGLDAFRVLYQGVLELAGDELLPTGESTRLVKTILLANTTGLSVPSVQLFAGGLGADFRLVNLTLPAQGSASFGQDGWKVYDANGNLLTSNGPAASGETLQAPFGFGDATPATVAIAPAGRTLLTARLVITEDFDGTGASLTLGDALDPDRFITAAQNDPTAPGLYETTPIYAYGSATNVLLTITPGSGATRGAGLIQLEFAQ